MVGRVVSTKMQKTAVVLVESKKVHPLYGKRYSWSKKYLADDEMGVKEGDIVEIVKIRPISKRKHWKVTKVIGRDIVAMETEELKEDAAEAIAEVMPEEEEVQSELVDQRTSELEEQKTVAAMDEEPKVEKVKEEKVKKAPRAKKGDGK